MRGLFIKQQLFSFFAAPLFRLGGVHFGRSSIRGCSKSNFAANFASNSIKGELFLEPFWGFFCQHFARHFEAKVVRLPFRVIESCKLINFIQTTRLAGPIGRSVAIITRVTSQSHTLDGKCLASNRALVPYKAHNYVVHEHDCDMDIVF